MTRDPEQPRQGRVEERTRFPWPATRTAINLRPATWLLRDLIGRTKRAMAATRSPDQPPRKTPVTPGRALADRWYFASLIKNLRAGWFMTCCK
jgi:hypothetical protein